MAPGNTITDGEVIDFVTEYLTRNGLGGTAVTAQTEFIELGLDSITTVGMLIAARDELVRTGQLDPSVKVQGLPTVIKVGDLADLMRGLATPVG